MIHAYDKNYLSKAQTNLATMFDFAVYDLKEDITDFFQKFLQSKISSQFERGEASVLVGKSGVELAIEIFDDEKLAAKYRPVLNKSPEYWCGWALAYFQWFTNLSFQKINDLIPINEVPDLYSPYHEMDICQF